MEMSPRLLAHDVALDEELRRTLRSLLRANARYFGLLLFATFGKSLYFTAKGGVRKRFDGSRGCNSQVAS